jgi:hypothetical protein
LRSTKQPLCDIVFEKSVREGLFGAFFRVGVGLFGMGFEENAGQKVSLVNYSAV